MTDINPELIERAAKAGFACSAANAAQQYGLGEPVTWDRHLTAEDRAHEMRRAHAALEAVADDLRAEGAVQALEALAEDLDLEDAARASGLNDLDFDWEGHYWEAVAEHAIRARAAKLRVADNFGSAS